MIDSDDDVEWLMLDKTTGLVHDAEDVVGPGGPHLCDCELIEDSYDVSALVTVTRRHLEIGIWEEAPCLQEESD